MQKTGGGFEERAISALTICMENPVISVRIQEERFIPVEIFRKNGSTSGGLPFPRFYRNYPTNVAYQCQTHKRKRNFFHWYFLNVWLRQKKKTTAKTVYLAQRRIQKDRDQSK